MSAAALLLGFLNAALFCAVIILIAFAIVWVLGIIGFALSADVMKWGKIVVGLLCLIVLVSWLLSVVGLTQPFAPRLLR